ncbi:MAG: MarR family transcriptional regulator [Kiritimatiellae bacterium]|nr:MarR family transcriptional regulator [Kiritimatiellia bacterium]
MYEAITEAEACTLLAELSAARLAGVGKGTLRYAILKTLGEAGELTQKQLAERLGKHQTAISRAAKGLLESELIHRNKQGREVKYRPMAEISLAAGSL